MTDHPSLSEQRAPLDFVAAEYARDGVSMNTLAGPTRKRIERAMLAFAQPPASGVDRSRETVELLQGLTALNTTVSPTWHALIDRAILALTNSGAPVPGDALKLAIRVRVGNVVSLTFPDGEQAEVAMNAISAALAHAAPAPSDEAETYRQMHDIATRELGYPSILEALEATPPAIEAGVPAVMVLDANRVKWLKAAAEFLDHCAGTELEFEGYEHGALAIVEGLHEALFDDEMDMPFHEAVAWCLDNTPKQATPTDEAASQGWRPIETAPKDAWILIFMPGEDDGMGQLHAARNRKVMNGYSWVVGHQFGHDLPKRTHWMPLPESPAPGSAGEGSDV